jgi:opacity protein-like surface antigen
MARLVVLLVTAAVAAATAASVAGAPALSEATAACATRSFTIAFDPKRGAVLTDGGHVLASVSFTSRFISGRCRRAPDPSRYDAGGFGAGIGTHTSFRCLTSKPIRVHVSATHNGSGAVIGGGLIVGIGNDTRLRVIASATLSRKGGRYSSRVYRAATYCKLGARAH